MYIRLFNGNTVSNIKKKKKWKGPKYLSTVDEQHIHAASPKRGHRRGCPGTNEEKSPTHIDQEKKAQTVYTASYRLCKRREKLSNSFVRRPIF